MNITVKTAGLPDIADIAALAGEIWDEHYVPIIGAGQVRYMLEKFQSEPAIKHQICNDGYVYFLAYAESLPVAYGSFKQNDDGLFLSKLYVKKEYRKMGIAAEIIENATNYFSFSSGEIYLTVNKNNNNSIASYKRLGFVIAGDIVADIGGGFVMDDYKMIKTV